VKGGFVYLVGAGPGDPGLITLRGLECLKQANVVIYDRLINRSLLAYARHAELIDVGKQPNCHILPQAEINALLIEKARAGKVVVRLKGGDPFVFGRGGEEAVALAEAGLPFEVVPGVTSAIAAPAYAGIPVTHRGMACSVAFATGHRADSIEDPTCDWRRLACGCDTLVFLMGVHNLPRIVEQLIAHGRSPDTPVALVERATHTNQKTVVGTLANIVERAAGIRPPAAIIIGEVVRLRETLRWFDLPDRHPLLGLRVLNTKPLPQAGELSQRLRALGAEPVELPTAQVMPVTDSGPLDAAIMRLRTAHTGDAGKESRPDGPSRDEGSSLAYDWIFFTSADSASFFINRLFALGHDVRALAGAKLAVADRAIAEILLEYGLVADFIPIRYTTWDGLAGQRVLLLRADTATPDPSATISLADTLSAQGARVETVAAYTIRPADPDPVALSALLDGEVDVVTFTNSSSLTSLTKMLNNRSVAEVLSPLTVACIGSGTADVARALGIRLDIVAEEHTADGLVEALVKWHKQGRL
jgi:uroporphyrinogen III methyltransferase/synthase